MKNQKNIRITVQSLLMVLILMAFAPGITIPPCTAQVAVNPVLHLPPDTPQLHMAYLMPQMVQAFQKVENKEVIHNYKLVPVENPGQLFKLAPQQKLKMIQGTRIRNFESTGRVTEPGGVTRPLRGVVLDEVIISKIEGQTLPSALVVLVDTIPILLYDPAQSRYAGALSITLLEDKEGILLPKALVEPVLIEVTSGGRAEIIPSSFRIDHKAVWPEGRGSAGV